MFFVTLHVPKDASYTKLMIELQSVFFTYVNSLLVLQNLTGARRRGNIMRNACLKMLSLFILLLIVFYFYT